MAKPFPPDPRDWHPADVMAALRKTKRKWSLRKLSLARGYNPSAAEHATRYPWPAVEEIIARELREFGISHPKDIWPSRYNSNGTPKRRTAHSTSQRRSSSAA